MSKAIFMTKNILNSANDFKAVTLMILSQIDENNKYYPTPFFVNGVFAIELYLKTIYLANNKKYINTHELKKIYGLLPPKDKEELLRMQNSIDKVFEYYNDSFEKWRYSYEKNGFLHGNDGSILDTLDTLDKYCNSKYKVVIHDFYNS